MLYLVNVKSYYRGRLLCILQQYNIAKDLDAGNVLGSIGLGGIKNPKAYIAGNNETISKGFPNAISKSTALVEAIRGVTGVLAGLKERNMLSAVLLARAFAHPGLSWSKGSKGIIGCP